MKLYWNTAMPIHWFIWVWATAAQSRSQKAQRINYLVLCRKNFAGADLKDYFPQLLLIWCIVLQGPSSGHQSWLHVGITEKPTDLDDSTPTPLPNGRVSPEVNPGICILINTTGSSGQVDHWPNLRSNIPEDVPSQVFGLTRSGSLGWSWQFPDSL